MLKSKKSSGEPEELSMSMKTRKPEPYDYEITSKMNQDEFFKATKRLTGNPKRWEVGIQQSNWYGKRNSTTTK